MEQTTSFLGVGEHPARVPSRPRSKRRRAFVRYGLPLVFVLVVIGALAAIKGSQIMTILSFAEEAQRAGPPPEAVAAATARALRWEETLHAVGTVASNENVSIRSEVPGVVQRIAFDSGNVVREGQVLVTLDDRIERAELASAVAAAELARVNAERTRELARRRVVARAELDRAEADLRTAIARVEMQRGVVAKKTIRAPFAGRLGIRAVSVGQYIDGGTVITELGTTEGTFVDFTLPQQDLARVAVGTAVGFRMNGGRALAGSIAALGPIVDESTRSIRLRAQVNGGEERLRPGMFVEVTVHLPERGSVVVVPATAIVHAPYGDSLFVLETPRGARSRDGHRIYTARQKFVRTGQRRGDFVAITRGVDAGERVVSAGAFKLRNGVSVYLSSAGVPVAELSPHPPNR